MKKLRQDIKKIFEGLASQHNNDNLSQLEKIKVLSHFPHHSDLSKKDIEQIEPIGAPNQSKDTIALLCNGSSDVPIIMIGEE